ncbi:NlpC/P60 family protein [Streptomyces griseiscabiei]|uniref:NlpC/P60 family protein n=1 Tax=Streptomyces griseiscabiei TaxID=2993540 RepID=A0ABU4L3M2_9ACTN|nr:NlpC/P60 family protein [Streptomyces griseiscabiei]MBZ3906064.1 C40 family peptidase [Streptomyces griseiscabiei]MDX2909698.1 NlpC/P60 family protein [Streptomyces griseiscabiei]
MRRTTPGDDGPARRRRFRPLRLLLTAAVTTACLGLPTTTATAAQATTATATAAQATTATAKTAAVRTAAPAAATDTCAPLKAGGSIAAVDAVETACRYLGKIYAWGGGHAEGLPGPSQGIPSLDPMAQHDTEYWSFDCIGLVRWAWYKATRQDLISERTTQSTWQNPGYAHTRFTKEQGEAPLLPGDILYFGANLTHVALYLGDGKYIEAPESGYPIRIGNDKWDRYRGALRPLADGVFPVWEYDGHGKELKTWGQPNLRADSHTGSAINWQLRNGISVAVRGLCQRVGERATYNGMVNNVWTYLPDYRSWVSNLFLQGPAIMPGVPSCGEYSRIGGTLAGADSNTSCGDGTEPNGSGAWTAKSTIVWGRTVELRYNSTTACAWGRIIGGTIGDEIWVDRSADGGKTWDPMLGYAKITSGTDAYTSQWNDNGLVMRACGTNGKGGTIACTDWF